MHIRPAIYALFAMLALGFVAGCSLPAGLTASSDKGSAKSHGKSIQGYGAITFGMSREQAFAAISGRGQFQRLPSGKAEALVYDDYIDYVPVRVVQIFDDKGKAAKAEAYASDGQRPMSLADCQGLYQTLYAKLHSTYREPDWPPREEDRRGGKYGVLMYTFADGSHITLHYDYIAQGGPGLCTVRIAVSPSSLGEKNE
jgi:hypothetical protein